MIQEVFDLEQISSCVCIFCLARRWVSEEATRRTHAWNSSRIPMLLITHSDTLQVYFVQNLKLKEKEESSVHQLQKKPITNWQKKNSLGVESMSAMSSFSPVQYFAKKVSLNTSFWNKIKLINFIRTLRLRFGTWWYESVCMGRLELLRDDHKMRSWWPHVQQNIFLKSEHWEFICFRHG